MKSILKERKIKLPQGEGAGLSSSVSGVRWALPEQDLPTHSSAPSISSNSPRQKDLRNLRSLQECVKFLTQWKEEVDRVCKPGGGAAPVSSSSATPDTNPPQSLEQCRKLILQWADELKNVSTLFVECEERQETDKSCETEEDSEDEAMEVEQRIMEWAKELQTVSESCGVMREELAQTLRQLEVKKKKVKTLLPFLEFVTWSLLRSDQDMVPQVWLLCKQRTWKAETPKYIPNSVWTWISSAAVDVSLDPLTSHPWIQVSEDRKRVQEALSEMDVEPNAQRFDSWPCVLGWEGFSSGRHYWEVELANNGYWRLGVTTASSKRHGRIPMNPRHGYWVIWKSTRQFYACTKPETPLPPALVPKRVGIYLDFEEGQVSFYNAEARSHIYTFTGNFKEKLYPLFAPLDGRTLMTLWSPETESED